MKVNYTIRGWYTKMKAIQCEMCSSTDIVKKEGFFVCQYCGTKYTVDEARKLMANDEPIAVSVKEPIKVVNNDFESKLASAENAVSLYLDKGKRAVSRDGRIGYLAIELFFADAEKLGANESRYWEKYAEYIRTCSIQAFNSRELLLVNKSNQLDALEKSLDFAIKYSKADDKERLMQKKKQLLAEYIIDLDQVEINQKEMSKKNYENCSVFSFFAGIIICAIMSLIGFSQWQMDGEAILFAGLVVAIVGILIGVAYKSFSKKMVPEIDELKRKLEEKKNDISN